MKLDSLSSTSSNKTLPLSPTSLGTGNMTLPCGDATLQTLLMLGCQTSSAGGEMENEKDAHEATFPSLRHRVLARCLSPLQKG